MWLLLLMFILLERHKMSDDCSTDVDDEVKQNIFDQMHPDLMLGDRERAALDELRLAPTEEILALPAGPVSIPGLSKRANELVWNREPGLPEQGAARQRRLKAIDQDIAAINRFLPRMKEIRAFLDTMPTDGDDNLDEAKKMADLKLAIFIAEVSNRLLSLEQELELKRPTT